MGWVRMEVWTERGTAWIEVKVKRDIVEWWLGGRSVAMMDRELLGRWLANPVGELSCHEVTITQTQWGPAISILDRIPPTLVSPLAFEDLREKAQAAT